MDGNEYKVSDLLTTDQTIDTILEAILVKVYAQTGKPAAIIVDEYDKPVLTYLANATKAEEMRSVFRSLYAPVKDSDRYIRFFWLSGLTKVMKMNIFSVLNNLKDISISEYYYDLVWFTQDQIEKNFADEIDDLVRKEGSTKDEMLFKIKERYNGYNFGDNEDTVYNPWDINNLMHD